MKRVSSLLTLTLLLAAPVMGYTQVVQQGPPQTQMQSAPPIGAPVAVTPEEQKDIDNLQLNLENITLKVQMLSSEVNSRVASFQTQFDAYSAEMVSLIAKIKAAHGYGSDVIFDAQQTRKLVRLNSGAQSPSQGPPPVPPSTSLNQPKAPTPPVDSTPKPQH